VAIDARRSAGQYIDRPNDFEVMQSAGIDDDAYGEPDAQPVQILSVSLLIGGRQSALPAR
jgi:hypothetical protein